MAIKWFIEIKKIVCPKRKHVSIAINTNIGMFESLIYCTEYIYKEAVLMRGNGNTGSNKGPSI